MNKAFDRIAGYEEEKKELSNLAKILKDRDRLIEAGGELPQGILITGELGQGKTTIVEAFIKETGLSSVLITPNNIQGMYDFKGYIESKIKEVKDKSPSIVFFDDIEDVEDRTSDMLFGPDKNGDSVKQFLGTIEKFKNDNDLFFVFASTGLTSISEKVVKIMGINKEIELPRPTEYERAEIIKHYLKNKKVSKNVDINDLARMTHNFRCV